MGGVIVCIIITAISLAADNYYISLQGHHLPLLLECGPFVMWLAYPAIGYYMGSHGRGHKIWPWLIALIISLVVCMIEAKWLYGFQGEGLGATKISALCFSFSAIMVLFGERTQKVFNPRRLWYRVLVIIGEISFGIYLIHKYFLDYLVEPLVHDTLLRAALTLIITTGVIVLIKRIIPISVSRILGFR